MAFSQQTILAVWAKGKSTDNNDPAEWRKDRCNAWMQFSKYGDRDSQYGWEIDHITPEKRGGTDSISNLQPLQWENNAAKSSGGLDCAVTANGKKNVPI